MPPNDRTPTGSHLRAAGTYSPPPVQRRRIPRLGVSPEEDQEVYAFLEEQSPEGNRTGDTPVVSREFMQTISRLEWEIKGLHEIVEGLRGIVRASKEELVKAREELHEVLTLLRDQHTDQREARAQAADERREAREQAAHERRESKANTLAFLERLLTPSAKDPWFRRGSVAGLVLVALVFAGVTYVQLSRDGVTVGAPTIEAVEVGHEPEPGSSPRP